MAYATRRSYAGAAPACTLTNAITSSDTTASLTGDVTNWNNTANGGFYMVIDPGLSTEEKVFVGSRSSTSLSSMTRGVDGTTAAAHAAGATCYPVFTAIDADQANKVASTLTTKGDLLVTDGSVLNRLAVGTNDYALVADSAQTNGVKWAVPTDTTKVPLSTVTTKGDLLAASASSTVTRLAAGTNEYRLVADSAQTAGLKYVADTTNYAVGAKGDILVGTAADTVTNVAVGTNDHVLTADSAQASGVKWAAVPSPGLTLISSTTIGSAVSSVTVSDVFSSTYDNYRVFISGGAGSTSLAFAITFGSTSTNYYAVSYYVLYGTATSNITNVNNGSSIPRVAGASTTGLNGVIDIISPNLAEHTYVSANGNFSDQGGAGFSHGYLANTTQYTAFTLTCSTGNVTGGTIKVYGYKN